VGDGSVAAVDWVGPISHLGDSIMTALLAGTVIKRKKNPPKKGLIAIQAPAGTTLDLSAVVVQSVENSDASITWTPTIKDQQPGYILVELNRNQTTLAPALRASPKSKQANLKAVPPFATDPPSPGTLTITLTNVPTGVSSVITNVPVVFVEDTP
jgi:hypothetical protein